MLPTIIRSLCCFVYLVLLVSISMESEATKIDINHDVFISFRGSDIRQGFLSHLVDGLHEKQIIAFVDNQINKGDEIAQSLFQAIETSFISLVIFSENYASSRWCLDELVKIVECREKDGQILVPVFYKLDPTIVRHQNGTYANAFVEHDKKFNLTTVQQWKSVLKESASISGYPSSMYANDSVLVKDIVQYVLSRLDDIHNKHQPHSKRVLIGLGNQISHVKSLLLTDSKDVRAIGIWGMAGIGKTTIAEEVFDRLCSEYKRCLFMADVREEWGRHGRMRLKKKFYSDLLREPDLNIDRPRGLPISVEWRLRRMKVLVVLDDVSDEEQLEILIGSRTLDWFGRGSRIIITTRDKQVLAKRVDDNDVYELKPLDFDDSFELFILTAFGQNHAKMDTECNQFSFYHKYLLECFLSKMINYAQGIPLVLKELGHFIGGKYRKTWNSECGKLTRVPLKNVHDAIGLSCNDLNRVEKEAWDFALMQMRFDHIQLLLNVDNKQLVCIDIKRHFCFLTNQLFRFDRNYSLFDVLIEHGMTAFDDMRTHKLNLKSGLLGFSNQASFVSSLPALKDFSAFWGMAGIAKTTFAEEVYIRLNVFGDMHMGRRNLKRGLIGLGNHISHVESLLLADSKDVRAIGIWGITGIGKTTIAEEVFDRLCSEYDSCYFKANVREEWRIHGRMFLKKELYSTLLRKEDLNIERPHGLPYFVERRLRHMKVLIVLDDVSEEEQLEILIETLDWFGRGSRIIITSRDKQVLLNMVDDNDLYEVKRLDFHDSFLLFNSTAVEQNHHPEMTSMSYQRKWSNTPKLLNAPASTSVAASAAKNRVAQVEPTGNDNS